MRVEQRLSPRAFDRIQRELLRADLLGLSLDDCVRFACSRVGLWPKAGDETVLVVDSTLTSIIYPFEEKGSEDEIYERARGSGCV